MARSSCTRTGAPRRRRSTAASPWPMTEGRSGHDPHGYAQRKSGFVENTIAAIQGPHHPRVSHRRGRAAATRPTSSGCAGFDHVIPVVDQSDPALHQVNTHLRASRHAHGVPSSRSGRSRKTSPSRKAGSARRRSRPRTFCTTWARSRSSLRTARPWAGSARCMIRTWQTADKMKTPARTQLDGRERPRTDNLRVKPLYRQIHHQSGDRPRPLAALCRVDRRPASSADLVLWTPAFFGVKPDMVLIGGSRSPAAQMGDPNASIPTPQPVYTRARCSGPSEPRG